MQKIPQIQVERVLLLGSVGMTTGFLNFALDKRVPVTFLSQEGQYKGRLESSGRRDIALRLAQFRGLEDVAWRLSVAKPLTRAKIGAQRGVLRRCGRNHPQPALTEAIALLNAALDRIEEAQTLPELMGQEGSAARAYFHALPSALRRSLPFQGRNRRPPKDPVNALLSLGYGLLTAEIIGALMGVGLDPQIGIFHSSRGRMPALAEDVLEMFRAPVADSLALSLVNLGVMRAEHFEKRETDGGIVLTKDALTTYFKHYRRRMQTTFRNREGQPTSFRRELQAQAAHLRRVLLHQEPYAPFEAQLGGPNPAE